MKKILDKKKYWLISFFVLFLGIGNLQAQPGSGGDGDGEDPTDVPIDGGISFLLVAGAAYGLKKVLDKKK